MTDDVTIPETPAGAEIAGDFEHRGSKMSERESYSRAIEGLKMAADGCRNLATYFNREQWDIQADILDKVRAGVVRLGGIDAPGDAIVSTKKFSGETMTRNASYSRVVDGLGQAAGGMLQMASGHRGDIRWSKIAFMAYNLRDTASKLVRMKKVTIYKPN